MKAETTEYQFGSVDCCCGESTRAPIPAEIRSGSGPRLVALVSYLTVFCRMPRRKVEQLLEGALGTSIALGSTQGHVEETSQALQIPYQELEQQLRHEPVLNGDETGWRKNGEKRWLWVLVARAFPKFAKINSRSCMQIALEAKVSFWRLFFLAVILEFTGVPAQPQAQIQSERPLPALDDFLKEVRKHLRSDRLLLSQYTYTERDTVRELDGKGKQKSTHESIYEVYPADEPGLTYRRLIAKDGKPTDPKDLEQQDRKHDKKLREHAKKLELEGTSERERRQAKETEEKRKEEIAIDELFRLYQIKMEGRDFLDEHPVIILSFLPRPGYKPRTDEGKILAKVAGRAWFSEQDYELIRIEVKLIDTISLGWGLLARINPGATGVLLRRKINDEIWLPAEVRFTGSARLLMVKGMNVDFSGQYSDFLKFTVETQVKFRKDK